VGAPSMGFDGAPPGRFADIRSPTAPAWAGSVDRRRRQMVERRDSPDARNRVNTAHTTTYFLCGTLGGGLAGLV
jgi:hypothetical protein